MSPSLSRLARFVLHAFLAIFATRTCLWADVIFSDGNFSDSDWTSSVVFDSTPSYDATFAREQRATTGNPGAFQRTSITFTYTGSGILQQVFVAHLRNTAIYNPSTQGAIASIFYTQDNILISNGNPDPFSFLLLQQAGTYYIASGSQTSLKSWTPSESSVLTATDFSRLGSVGPPTPNFSAVGSAIQFGYLIATGAAVGPPAVYTVVNGSDNWTVRITGLANVVSLENFSINPKGTFLRTANDPNALGPLKVPLVVNEIQPGDYLFLERFGDFSFRLPLPEDGTAIIAVFSSNDTVDPDPEFPAPPDRVPGAIPANVPPFVTANTAFNYDGSVGPGYPTDIVRDFFAGRVMVQVPPGATYLMVCAHDTNYGDNVDIDGDFQIKITRIRDTQFDTDGDGTTDIDEVLSGTDYADPVSRPFLGISASPLPGNVRTSWTAQPFRIYDIEESPDLLMWSPIETPPSFTVPTPLYRDYPLSPTNRFFRLRVKGVF